MHASRLSLLLLLPCCHLACDGDIPGAAPEPAPANEDGAPTDVRVPLPPARPGVLDLVGPEIVVPAGSEKMFCYHLRHDGPDLGVLTMETEQATGGHHLVLLTVDRPAPPGTVEDCSDAATMTSARPFVLPGIRLPPGHGVRLPGNTALVLQSHYINAGEKDLLVRDLARLHTVPPDQIGRWTTTLTSNRLALSLAPRQSGTLQIDCPVPEELDLLLLLGHMHELGSAIEVTLHAPGGTTSESLYLVEPWRASYRDAPPVTAFPEPRRLPAGSRLTTRCTWNNTGADVVGFPAEMCSSIAYVAGPAMPRVCQ